MKSKFIIDQESKSIAIIGAGWYGAHLAYSLQKSGHSVTLFEKNPEIMSENSGKFAVRLHAGPHYPRSPETRKSCQSGLDEFREKYKELVVEHEYSIYALGNKDSKSNPSKVSKEEFEVVGKECKGFKEIDSEQAGYKDLNYAMEIDEPSVLVGKALRKKFMGYLTKAEVNIVCDFEVAKCEKRKDGKTAVVSKNGAEQLFDKVINTTSYQSLVTKPDFRFHDEVVFQPCVILTYQDNETENHPHPFSFTIMDGLFPCIMPYIDQDPKQEPDLNAKRKYVLYHAEWTPLRSCKTQEEAYQILSTIDKKFIKDKLKDKFESEIKRFWPEFENRFSYDGFVGSVIAKVTNNREFRAALTYEDSEEIINVFPGKVNNIFDVERETRQLMNNENIKTNGNYRYVVGGALDSAMVELEEKLDPNLTNSCQLQSYNELVDNPQNLERDALDNEIGKQQSEDSVKDTNAFSFKNSKITSFRPQITKEQQSQMYAPSSSPTRQTIPDCL